MSNAYYYRNRPSRHARRAALTLQAPPNQTMGDPSLPDDLPWDDDRKHKAAFAALEQQQEHAAFAAKMQRDMDAIAPEPMDADMPVHALRSQLVNLQDVQRFVFAGRAIITVVSKTTGARFTYRFKVAESRGASRPIPIFVSVLTGQDNNTCYSFLGTIWPDKPAELRRSGKSQVADEAPSFKGARWLIAAVALGDVDQLRKCEIWHEGRCGRCGRRLTVPESIHNGIGPECIKYMTTTS